MKQESQGGNFSLVYILLGVSLGYPAAVIVMVFLGSWLKAMMVLMIISIVGFLVPAIAVGIRRTIEWRRFWKEYDKKYPKHA